VPYSPDLTHFTLPLCSFRSPPTLPLLYGNLLHATLQTLLSTTPYPTRSTFSPQNIKRVSDQVLTEGDEALRGDLWKAGLLMEDVREEVGKKAVESFGKLGNRFLGQGAPKVSLGFFVSRAGSTQLGGVASRKRRSIRV
jgi:hypothetical protein